MAKLEQALARLTEAVAALEQAAPDWRAECHRLGHEVAALQQARAEDALLRAEAAEAVRAALTELREVAPDAANDPTTADEESANA